MAKVTYEVMEWVKGLRKGEELEFDTSICGSHSDCNGNCWLRLTEGKNNFFVKSFDISHEEQPLCLSDCLSDPSGTGSFWPLAQCFRGFTALRLNKKEIPLPQAVAAENKEPYCQESYPGGCPNRIDGVGIGNCVSGGCEVWDANYSMCGHKVPGVVLDEMLKVMKEYFRTRG